MGAADGGRRRGVRAASRARPGIRYTALVPNLAGLDRALAAGVGEIAIFAAVDRNVQPEEHQSEHRRLAGDLQAGVRSRAGAGLRVRGYLSTAFGCPYEGDVAPERVADVAARLLDLGVFEVAVSDTIGIAHPGQVPRVLDAVLARMPVDQVALHFHDTRGTALANVLAALPFGIDDLRRVGRRPRRLPVRARRGGQPGDRRPDLHAEWIGHRDRACR